MSKEILEGILREYLKDCDPDQLHEGSYVTIKESLDMMKLAFNKALEIAAENAEKAKLDIIESISEYLPSDIHMQIDVFDNTIEQSILKNKI